ncbi:MAG: caspase family protein, partial [Candidatus Parabeggiatoa sp.]|nr:caspase family protein [Candidatus Parabeggiatoa sp.]
EVELTELVTAAKLEQALSQLFNPQGTNIPETALFFFAGHGHRKNIGGILEGYLATSETNPNRRDWGVSLKWLRELLQKSPIKQQIVWLDCCYSGELLNFEDADPGERGKGRDRCFIAAAREYESAYEETTGNHGILTGALLQGLDPKQSADGIVDNLILSDFINRKLQGTPQRPLYANSGSKIILTGKKGLEGGGATLSGICPYKGLQFFDFNEEDPKYFYGRSTLTDELLEKVRTGNFLAVLGVSGSGKSSVVRAGLLHQLAKGQNLGSKDWKIYPPFTPAENNNTPRENLARLFVQPDLSVLDRAKALQNARELIDKGAAGLQLLLDVIDAPRVVIVVDQFEEIFTRCPDDTERQHFFDCLLGALAHNKLCLVIAMRADFMGKCTEHAYAGLAQYIQDNLVTVTPMTSAEFKQAITIPATQVGLDIEPDLITQMLQDVEGSPESLMLETLESEQRVGHCLPLLQDTLRELWERRVVNRLTLTAYTQLGGVNGTLKNRADKVYQSLLVEEQSVAQWIFLELTQLGEGTEDTRKQVFKPDLITAKHSEDLIDKTLQRLTDARLVVMKALAARGDQEKSVTVVDVAHEALIRHWPRLRGWLNENRDALRKRREIDTAAKEWEAHGKSKHAAYLLQGPKLNTAEDYINNDADKVPLSNLSQEFVQKSIKYRQKRRYSLIGMVMAVILVLAGFAFYANEQRKVADEQRVEADEQRILAEERQVEADEQRKVAEKQRIEANRQKDAAKIAQSNAEKSEQAAKEQTKIALVEKLGAQSVLATQIPSAGNSYYEQALLLAIQAFKDKDIGTSRSNLLRVLQAKKRRKAFLYSHSGDVTSVSFSPDGKTLASGSRDNTVRLWDIQTRQLLGEPLVGHSSDVNSVAFSPDGKTLASGSNDNTVRFWNIQTRQLLGEPLVGHSGDVNSVAFSPDGKTLALGSWETVRLWDVETKQPLSEPLAGHPDDVYHVVFSPNGKVLASMGNDNTVRLWDVKTKQLLGKPLIDNFGSVVFSPDGQILASGGKNNTVRLWDVQTRQPLGEPLVGHSSYILSMAFSPDGQTLVSGGWDNTVRLWNIETGQMIGEPLIGHSYVIQSVAFSSDGKTIASGSRDNTVRLWDIETRQPLSEPLIGHSSYVYSVVFSPDGQTLVSGSGSVLDGDNIVRLWDIQTKQPLGEPLVGHSSIVTSVAFSPDGQILASGSFDNTVRLWDIQTRLSLGKPLVGHSSSVESVAFSIDGQILASGSADNTVRLWDIQTRQPLGDPLVSHSTESVVFSPNGQTLASGEEYGTIKLWNVKTKQQIGELLANGVTSMDFSPDGQTLVASGGIEEYTIGLWDIETRQQFGERLVGHSEEVMSVAFSPDGRTIASGGRDDTVRLWDVQTRQPLGEPLINHSWNVFSVAFSPDGQFLASGNRDGSVTLWDVNPESWAKKACAIVNRNFSHEEWQKYMGKHRPHEKTCPNLPKDTLGAIELTQQARELLREGKTELAKAKFAKAREWDANVVFGDN